MKIVFDCKLGRPACALLQTIGGGTQGIAGQFPVESWLLEPTNNMKTYEVSKEELQLLIQKVEKCQKQQAQK